MAISRRIRTRLVTGGVVLAIAVIAAAGLALAAKPKAGWTYTTSSQAKVSVSFKAASAKRLSNFSATEATKCPPNSGGFGGVKTFTRSSVRVSRTGTFKVRGSLFFATGKKIGTQTVTGRFVDGGKKATGRVVSHFKLGSCHGTTASYTAMGTAP